MSAYNSIPNVPKESGRKEPPLRSRARDSHRSLSVVIFLLCLSLFGNILADWAQIPVAHAATQTNPNPALNAPSWLQSPNAVEHTLVPKNSKEAITAPPKDYPRPKQKTTPPSVLSLTSQAQQVVTKDGHLEITIPAGTVNATQIKAAGGVIHLQVTQTDPGSGGGSGGRLLLGTYQLLLLNAQNKPLTTLVLVHPLTLKYRLQSSQSALVLQDQAVYAFWQNLVPPTSNTTSKKTTTNSTQAAPSSGKPVTHVQVAKKESKEIAWSVTTTLSNTPLSTSSSSTAKTSNQVVAPAEALSTSTITFSTQAPQASWGTSQNFDVGLSSGGLQYSYPLSVPPGAGGLTPSLSLNYSSGSVNESHNVQAAASWVGEGWNLGLGSISWSNENVTPGGSNRLENVWYMSDPTGISGQLIPPDMNVSTSSPRTPSPLPSQYIWHTAPESHAKIQEVSFDGGAAPCWHVWLPNGTLEEFGCTADSQQGAQDSNSNWNTYRWDLNLIVDRNGNQIRVNYQRDFPSGFGAVRDAVISSIEYDDPSCHQTSFTGPTAACSNWHPNIRLVFDADNKASSLTGGNCGSWSDGTYRCDDPTDLSGSGGLGRAKVLNTYVLNDVQVQVKGHLLHKYVFSYEQTQPQTITDPLSGAQESVAGYLDLTKIQEQGTNGTTLNAPITTVSYTTKTQRYVDLWMNATNPPSCPSWTTSNSGGCVLWSQSYNGRYISTLDNGQGWHENISWNEAHGNTHGVSSGDPNDPFACNGHQAAGTFCGTADDHSWSRIVVTSRSSVTNGVTSTWNYQYSVNGYQANWCGDCRYGYTWGNQNDLDYADFYNGQFTSFASAQVTQPDGSYQIETFSSTTGWGIAPGMTCSAPTSCHDIPYWNPDPGMAGHTKTVQNFSPTGKLLTVKDLTYAMNCPPAGVGHTGTAYGGGVGAAAGNPGDTQRISLLDQNNPVVVCDPRVTQEDDYQVDGVTDVNNYKTDSRVLHKTTTTAYDGDNKGVGTYDYGNISKVDVTANDVGGAHFIARNTYYPSDNLGSSLFLTNLPAYSFTQDASSNTFGCMAFVYGANTAPSQAPQLTQATQTSSYLTNGACSGASATTRYSYDATGSALTGIDADNHLGCTSGSSQFSTCATYDAFNTHLLTVTNAKNQTVTYGYDSASAAGGFGQWLLSTTDTNGQTSSYQYDALGRLTAVIKPGDSASSPTITYTYTNTCSSGSTAPCLEIDTTTRITVGSTQTTTTQQLFDGLGRLVETKTPGPNMFSKVPAISSVLVTYTLYDNMGRPTTQSLPYAVSAAISGYVTPDQNQPRTVTNYDSLGRSLGSVTYSDTTTITLSSTLTYTVAQGIPGFSGESSSTAFEQTATFDAYNHKTISFTDALGRLRYQQEESGTGATGSSYGLYRTLQYTYDTVGNLLSTKTYDSSSTQLTFHTATYDALKRITGWNDSDEGSCINTPMPTSCGSSSDTAWKITYDADSNVQSQTDPRGQSIYASYDLLNRPLCRGTSSAAVSPCGNNAYVTFFYDSYDNASNAGLTFPSGCAAPSGTAASNPIGQEVAETFSASVGSGWRCYGFDARGQLDSTGLSVTADGKTTTQTAILSYNDIGEPISLTYPDGETLTSQYDKNGYFHSAFFGTSASTDPVPFLVGQTSYTNNGLLSGLALGGSAVKSSTPSPVLSTSYGYDKIQRQISDTVSKGGSTLWNQVRTFDNVGNVLNVVTILPTTSGGTQTDSQSFCYDNLNRVVWSGNSGTPAGGDHCGTTPSGTSISTYQQAYSYDVLDRLINGPSGTTTYDSQHVHAAIGLSSAKNPYASYDSMGNMTCRNLDPTGAQSCDSAQTGSAMSYDAEGRLSHWTAPQGQSASADYLYDSAGNRVLQRTSSSTTVSDTLYFNGLTETTLSGSTTSTSKYYTVMGQRVAMKKDGTLSYLIPDLLSSASLTLKGDGTVQSVQLFAPYGTVRYSQGTSSTSYNFTGQRLDELTGLLYYGSRYYDPYSGRFLSADTVETNASGFDPYAYVHGNPETFIDPTGHMEKPESGEGGSPGEYGGNGGGGGGIIVGFIKWVASWFEENPETTESTTEAVENTIESTTEKALDESDELAQKELEDEKAYERQQFEKGLEENSSAETTPVDETSTDYPLGSTSTYEPPADKSVFPQEAEGTCVAASCRMLLNDNNFSLTEKTVQTYTGTDSQFGGGMENVPNALSKIGVRIPYSFMRNATIADLQAATGTGNSAIVSIRAGLIGTHAIVLDGFDELGNALVRDPYPYQGAYGIPMEQFMDLFTGRAVVPNF
ncbi:RHS repeat-associated core domain-containing protein [Ktedonospora formicarum]|uniref:DUF6443 domain-containing protein n=1 Tax=Ktedonospora formicarum TaxID=2778364 RepID=A0A8J3MXK8_9CHLR|nr:RHS repeat-associated core domain-containing protein [Ktedonospora formicarum]GHO48680.1 hypothetical protein KSX_68430 [Ktedonospora formicarum]